MLPALIAMAMLADWQVAGAASPTVIFSYPNGFAGAGSAINLVSDGITLSGPVIELTNGAVGQHEAGAAWYKTQVDITSFTTDFTFQLASGQTVPAIIGITFCVQNSNSTTNPGQNGFGNNVGADTNLAGYGAFWYPTRLNSYQYPIGNSIAIKFDMNNASGTWVGGGTNAYLPPRSPNSVGLFINGGPSNALIPQDDINFSGINFYTGHVMAAHVVYDGSLLTLVLRDTVTNAQLRKTWPVNIPAVTQGSTAWVGFTAGSIPAVANNLLTWTFSQGYATRLATPTFSVSAGAYTSAQTVSINGPAGATIYYTTNGQQPTTSSSQYTGPISVSSNEVVQAIAVETGFTDSLVAVANYQIAPANAPIIDFPSGFAAASNLIAVNGTAKFSSSALQLTDTNGNSMGAEVGTAWYAVPVNVGTFTTNFTLSFQSASANGMTFCIQNQPPASSDTSIRWVSGGINTMGNAGNGLGYSGTYGGIINSVAVKFDLYSGTGNDTGLYTNGADVSQNGISMNGSGVSLKGGNPLAVSLSYDGTTLSMTVTDTVSHASYSRSWAINIPSTVGGNTAYVGFTGATGGLFATQQILAWTYSSQGQTSGQPPPVPMAPTNFAVH
jgi:hypothetical protein